MFCDKNGDEPVWKTIWKRFSPDLAATAGKIRRFSGRCSRGSRENRSPVACSVLTRIHMHSSSRRNFFRWSHVKTFFLVIISVQDIHKTVNASSSCAQHTTITFCVHNTFGIHSINIIWHVSKKVERLPRVLIAVCAERDQCRTFSRTFHARSKLASWRGILKAQHSRAPDTFQARRCFSAATWCFLFLGRCSAVLIFVSFCLSRRGVYV